MAQLIKNFEQAVIGDVVKLNHDIHGETGKFLTVIKSYDHGDGHIVDVIDSDLNVIGEIPARALTLVKRYE